MLTHRVEGFNDKEQKIFNVLLDGESHDIRELKKLFWKNAEVHCKEVWDKPGEHEFNAQAQSYVRNSLRRLIRDNWVRKCGRGTYILTAQGKKWVSAGKSVTKSKTESQRGKGGGKKVTKKTETSKSKTKAKPKVEKKAKTKKAATKAKPKVEKKAKTKKAATKGNGVSKKKKINADKLKAMKAKTKVEAAKEKFASQAAN